MKNTYLLIIVLLIVTGGFLYLKFGDLSHQTKATPTTPTPLVQLSPTPSQTSLSHGISLTIATPQNNAVASSSSLVISGTTAPNAQVFIGTTPLKADSKGAFKQTTTLDIGDNLFVISANDDNGNYAQQQVTVSFMQVVPTAKQASSVHLTEAKVVSVKGTSISISKDGRMYNLVILPTTKLRTKFGDSAKLSEVKINDIITLWGTYTSDTHTDIEAQLVRDTSLVSLTGIFFGTIGNPNSNAFTLQTGNLGNVNVTITDAKLMTKKNTSIQPSVLQSGDVVRVEGTLANQAIESTQVLDFTTSLASASAH